MTYSYYLKFTSSITTICTLLSSDTYYFTVAFAIKFLINLEINVAIDTRISTMYSFLISPTPPYSQGGLLILKYNLPGYIINKSHGNIRGKERAYNIK